MQSEPSPAVLRAASGIGAILGLMLVGGAVVSPFWTPGIFVTLGAAVIQFGMNLVVGIVGYRHVMSRPWPQVPPLTDDDDDW
jgi:hypothetical protein